MQPIDRAYDVCNLQPSREGALPKNEEPNNVLNIDQHEYLKLHHPEDAFAKNLRGYVSTVMPALKCRMDMRRTDRCSTIVTYVSSYATKWHDAYDGDPMHSRQVGPSNMHI